MGEDNGDNDDRGLKARNRRWGRIAKAYCTIAEIDLIARHTRRRLRMSSDSRKMDLRPDQSDKEMGSYLNSELRKSSRAGSFREPAI